MEIVHKLVNSTLYIGMEGELDESSANYVRGNIDKLLDNSGMKRVVFDMSALSFMDSTGIGLLIGRYKKLKSKNVPIFLAGPSSNVDKVLGLSGIYSIMPKIDFK